MWSPSQWGVKPSYTSFLLLFLLFFSKTLDKDLHLFETLIKVVKPLICCRPNLNWTWTYSCDFLCYLIIFLWQKSLKPILTSTTSGNPLQLSSSQYPLQKALKSHVKINGCETKKKISVLVCHVLFCLKPIMVVNCKDWVLFKSTHQSTMVLRMCARARARVCVCERERERELCSTIKQSLKFCSKLAFRLANEFEQALT